MNNTCRKGGIHGEEGYAIGNATDPSGVPGKFEVDFFAGHYAPCNNKKKILFMENLKFNFFFFILDWVIGLGSNYDWAVVYSCETLLEFFDFESVWILAR